MHLWGGTQPTTSEVKAQADVFLKGLAPAWLPGAAPKGLGWRLWGWCLRGHVEGVSGARAWGAHLPPGGFTPFPAPGQLLGPHPRGRTSPWVV